MCKPNDRITTVLSDLLDVKNMIEELEAEAEQLTDEIKTYMGDEELMLVDNRKVTYRDDKIKTDGSSKYNFMWHVDFGKEILVDELVNAKVNNEEKPYLLHEFTL